MFAFNAKEFVDCFDLHARLKSGGYMTIEYSDDPAQPIFMSSERNGHKQVSGMPYFIPEKKEGEGETEESVDDEDSDEEDYDEDEEFEGDDDESDEADEPAGSSQIAQFRDYATKPIDKVEGLKGFGPGPGAGPDGTLTTRLAGCPLQVDTGPDDQADGSGHDALREAAAAGALLGVDG